MLMGAWKLGGGSKLPYDAEVEYLESTGTQYIDTGIKIDDDDYVLTCDFMITRKPDVAWARYFGTYTSETAKSTRMLSWGRDLWGYAGYRRQSNNQDQIKQFYLTERVVVELSYMHLSANQLGQTYSISLRSPIGADDDSSVGVFGSSSYMRCWGFCIAHQGYDDIDLQPVRFTNDQNVSEGAMYDRVSGELFRNIGTGAFVIGPDKT